MSLLDRFRATTDTETTGYEAARVDADLADALTTPGERDAISVRPDRENSGIEAMDDVLESLHSVETESGLLQGDPTNISPAHSFEMRYTRPPDGGDRVVSLRYVAGDDRTDGPLARQLQTQYSDSQLERTSAELLPGSDVEGRYVAGATLHLRRYTLYPIANIDLPGFTTDPTGSILEEMVGSQAAADTDADVVVQIQFKPAMRDWTEGVANGHGIRDVDDERVRGDPSIKALALNLRESTFEKQWRVFTRETIEYPPSKTEKKVANLLEEQQGEKGWRLCLRILAVSDDPDAAVSRASHTAGQFRNFFENNAEQTFVPDPCDSREVVDVAQRAATRDWRDHGIVKAQREVAGLVNVPESEHVTTNKMRWSLSRPGEGIPPGTPRFDFETADVAGGTDAEQQVAMLDESTAADPYWYGFGSRHGVEAGVEPDVLNTHQFVGGGTGKGKTTWLVNFASQIMERGHGGLIFDPKGKDADEFIREWPADRDREDLVFVDLSDEFDHQVRFNFLEVPSDADPDSRAFQSTVEALCDDLAAMLALAGGDDNYWGARMDRVVRTFIRGMARSGRTCTLLDLACACTSSENRERFTEWMTEERLHFIADTAERIEEFDDTDLEPLAGRLDQWVQNDAIRDLIAARESTVSMRNAVREGKVVVVRNAPSSGDTEKRLFATALIRRAWVATRENPDSPPFYVICDEFDSIVSEKSNIASILSEARAFEFCLTLSCQNPSNQLPDRVQKAIENQCETFISFNPGGRDDARLIEAQHSPEVEPEDLTNLSKYRFFMRTHDENDELTHSYKVDAFPPVADVRADVTGEPGMTDDDLQELKRESVERYGEVVASAEEQRAQSHFYGGVSTTDDGARIFDTEREQQAAVQAVYDTACRAGDPEGYIALAECRSAVTRRLAALPSTETYDDVADHLSADGDLWRRVLQHVDDDLLDVRERDGTPEVRATSPRSTIATVGGDQSAGGAGHALLLWNAYEPLTWAGLDLSIAEASGDDADALARPAPDDEQHAPALVERLTGGDEARVESESSTGRTKAGMTAQHVLQAANEGRRAIILTRPDDAQNVADTLCEPPVFCRSDHAVDDETRYYTSPRDVHIDGEAMTRPGGRANVWVRDDDQGDIVLRDDGGAEHARFDAAGDVFADAEPYPTDGERAVKQPIIPSERLDDDADPHAEIVTVPEDATALADLALVDDAESQLPATAVDQEPDDHPRVDPADLDVRDGARHLLALLRDVADESVTATGAHTLATEHGGPALDVSESSIRNYLGDLVTAGVVARDEADVATAPDEYRVR